MYDWENAVEVETPHFGWVKVIQWEQNWMFWRTERGRFGCYKVLKYKREDGSIAVIE